MVHFYVDHDVSGRVALLLRQHGHEATTVRDDGLEDADDGYLLLHAQRLSLPIATHNAKDFRLLHGAWQHWEDTWLFTWALALQVPNLDAVRRLPRGHAGILILPHGSAEESVQRLLAFLQIGYSLPNEIFRYQSQHGWAPYL